MNRLYQEIINSIGLIHKDKVGILVAKNAMREPVYRAVLVK